MTSPISIGFGLMLLKLSVLFAWLVWSAKSKKKWIKVSTLG